MKKYVYFKEVESIEELKKLYKKLAFKLHPDTTGGDGEDFKKMVNEYELIFKELQKTTTNKKEKAENFKDYADLIEALRKVIKSNVILEVCGTWLYLHGVLFEDKEGVKNLGFLWSKSKKCWYNPMDKDFKKSKKTGKSLKYIRNKYGSDKNNIKGDGGKDPLLT